MKRTQRALQMLFHASGHAESIGDKRSARILIEKTEEIDAPTYLVDYGSERDGGNGFPARYCAGFATLKEAKRRFRTQSADFHPGSVELIRVDAGSGISTTLAKRFE